MKRVISSEKGTKSMTSKLLDVIKSSFIQSSSPDWIKQIPLCALCASVVKNDLEFVK